MKTISKVTGVIFGISLFTISGVALADNEKADDENQANARGVEKSDIKRGMPITKPKAQQAGDPIPGIDITVNQGHSICQSDLGECDGGSNLVDATVNQKGTAKIKVGKALADTVKKVENDDVKHTDEDSDEDGQ